MLKTLLLKKQVQLKTLGFICAFFLMNCQNNRGEVAELIFKNLSINDGLSYNSIISIIQDSKERIWIGTSDGLNLFDGNQFKVFKHNDRDSNSLYDNHINAIVEAPDRTLWIGTNAGVCIYNPEKDIFTHINLKLKAGAQILGYISGIVFENKTTVWISSGFGLYRLDYKTMISTLVNNEINSEIAKHTITKIYLDKKNNLWIGTETAGIFLYDKIRNSLIKFKESGTWKAEVNNSTRTIFEDSRGILWEGTDRGLKQFDSKSNTFLNYTFNPDNEKGPLKGSVSAIFEDNQKRLWIGFQYGLSIYDRDKNEFTCIKSQANNSKSIAGDEVDCMMQDANGCVWFGMFTAGISIFDYNLAKFQFFRRNPDYSNSLIGNSVLTFCEDKIGNIWIGADHAGLDYFTPATMSFKHYRNDPYDKNSLSSDAVLNVNIDHQGILWIGTWGGGLNRFDPQTGIFKHYIPNPNNKHSINGMHIWQTLEDKYHNLFIATQEEGLGYYIRNKDSFISYKNEQGNNHSLLSNNTRIIYLDKQENIWIATGNGVSKFNYDSGSFTNYLQGKFVEEVYNDNKGTLWIGSYGLYSMDLKTNLIHKYSFDPEMDTNVVNGILEDAHNNLWVCVGNCGFLKIDLKTRKCKRYSQIDGLGSLSFNKGARLKLRNGQMMFGTTDGFILFHPDSIKDNLKEPKLIFTDFQIFNLSVKPGSRVSPLRKHISYTDTIVLKYNQSVISIYYAALNYIAPEKNHYAYMLEGFEKNWNYVGSKRDATYTNLNPGKYNFRVKVSVNTGIWDNKELVLTIVILPPYYMTWWFKVIILTMVLILLISVYYLRISQMKRTNIILTKLVEKRTAELAEQNEVLLSQSDMLNETNTLLEERQMHIEEQAEELMAQKEELIMQRNDLNELNVTKDKLFSILSHDLRSPFNTILGYCELLTHNIRRYPIEKIEHQIGVINSSAQNTYTLLNNLLEWTQSQMGNIHLEISEISISEILENELRILKQQADKKEVILNLTYNGEKYLVEADPNLLSTVMRNLISNAIKFSNKLNIVEIGLNFNLNSVTFFVKDEGVGIEDAIIQNLFKVNSNSTTRGTAGEKGTGLGLLLCADFIEKHHGKILVESKVSKGSTFSFIIPKKNAPA